MYLWLPKRTLIDLHDDKGEIKEIVTGEHRKGMVRCYEFEMRLPSSL